MSISGIIHSIIVLVCACLGSADGTVDIFCTAHMDSPTSAGRRKSLCSPGPSARSIQRKPLLSGTASLTMGSQEYSFCESPISRSG